MAWLAGYKFLFSWEIFNDLWSQPVCYMQRQMSPDLNRQWRIGDYRGSVRAFHVLYSASNASVIAVVALPIAA